MSARTSACPACGGNVDEASRHCPYCAAPVATRRCASCFHMNIDAALHCSGCGRDLGLEPIGESDLLTCPECKDPLTAFRDDAGVLRDCGRCGGQFVEHAMLRVLLDRCAIHAGVPAQKKRPASRLATSVHYVACPACATLMNRKNFGGSSGVIIDICKKHGIWFDLGELPRILAFAEAGGMARARERADEEQERAVRARAMSAVSTASLGSAGDPDASLSIDVVDLLAMILR